MRKFKNTRPVARKTERNKTPKFAVLALSGLSLGCGAVSAVPDKPCCMHAILANQYTVPLNVMKKFDSETKKFRREKGDLEHEIARVEGIPVDGKKLNVAVTHSGGHELFLVAGFGELSDVKNVIVSGAVIKLDALSRLYQTVNGEMFKDAKIVVEIGEDEEVGKYISIWVVLDKLAVNSVFDGVSFHSGSFFTSGGDVTVVGCPEK